jgi:hypothetical protein
MNFAAFNASVPQAAIDVVESGARVRRGYERFDLDHDIAFSTEGLESFAFARWEPVIYDAMVVAAAIEHADRSVRRPSLGWTRQISVQIAVHDPGRWTDPAVQGALLDAAGFLTGDKWDFSFVRRRSPIASPKQECLPFPRPTDAVIAYSDGMDSRAVASLEAQRLGDRLVRVRVGSKSPAVVPEGSPQPFARVPYSVRRITANGETSARSRGFKFALISGLAAYLAEASTIIVPESGQGAIGPALISSSAQGYPDYRNHPLFTRRMERFLTALLRQPVAFAYPRIWHTKGETLRALVDLSGAASWHDTRSCWRDSRWSSVGGKRRQCGVCAACMLRRMSVHAAGLSEDRETYLCEDLSAATLQAAVHPGFSHCNEAFQQYALAGTLHLDHLADMAMAAARPAVRRHATLTGFALGIPAGDAEAQLVGLLERHLSEWTRFLIDLGENSFVRKWTRREQ